MMKKLLTILLFLFLANISFSQEVRDHRNGSRPVSPRPTALTNAEVFFYENPNYDGRFELVKPNSTGTSNYSLVNFNDMVSSVQVPAGMVAIVYEHANQNGGYGNYVELMESCPDLSVYGLDNKASYVSVFPASKPGYNYLRTKNINGQIVAGHWERKSAAGKLPDNAPPAIVQYLQPKPIVTIPVVDEKLPVFRMQLRLVTGNGENDDTDKEVYVKFNNRDEEYFLDYGPDDFERGAAKKYDIISSSVRKISDIQFIEVGAIGDDVWGVKRVELYVNNSSLPVFSHVFSTAQRINGSGNWQRKIFFNTQQLRANRYWQTIATDANIKNPPLLIKADVIKSMVESMVGNQMHYKGQGRLYWGNKDGLNTVSGDHVEMKRKDGNTLSFDLDLEAEITGTNPEVDVDFDLVFECKSGAVVIKTANVKSSCDFNFPLLQPSCETIRSVINGFLQWFGLDRFMVEDFNTYGNTFNAMFVIRSNNAQCTGAQVTPLGDVVIY